MSTDAWPLWVNIAVFLAVTGIIGVAGTRTAGLADRRADQTGLGEAVAGTLFLGLITALPGLAPSVAAASVVNILQTCAAGFPTRLGVAGAERPGHRHRLRAPHDAGAVRRGWLALLAHRRRPQPADVGAAALDRSDGARHAGAERTA